MKNLFFYLICALLVCPGVYAQDGAKISAEELVYDFGNIIETDGSVSHSFQIKNTGSSPLVITRVTVSCGCTTPVWSKEPIEPGKTGEVTITYNPKGRPGPFTKRASVYSNGKKGAFHLNIKGNVKSKPVLPSITYPYSIGDLKLQSKTVLYNTIRPDESLGERIQIKNESDYPLKIKKGKFPNYLMAEVHPEVLKPGEAGEITILFNARDYKKKGRVITELPLSIETEGKKEKNGKIEIKANLIDNFSKLSASEKENAPIMELSTNIIEFGKVEEKGGILPVLGSKTSETITIKNTGKSVLTIYSIDSDDNKVDVSGGKKDLKPGTSTTFKVTIKPKEIKTKLESDIYIISNDPAGPVKMIKVTAEK